MLIVKDFVWSQTADEIVVRIPMKNKASKTTTTDILTSEHFVKLYAAPYYFELFPLHAIVEELSLCQLSSNETKLTLKKANSGLQWSTLEKQFESRSDKLQFKQQVLDEIQTRTSEKSKMRIEQREQLRRSQIEKATAKDAERRDMIEKFKRSIIEVETAKVDEMRKVEVESLAQSSSGNKLELVRKQEKPAPSIRKSAHIEIEFSKRNFVTPKRESQDAAEQEWIMKQNEARRNVVGFVEEDLLPEERDPMFLKSKGDDFFRKSNYLAAISAYTTGIRLASKCYELYLNRSAAHFASGNFQRCAEDCSEALELLQPPVESNRMARKQALMRRGAALTKLGFLRAAYGEFVAAVKLDPSDETLRNDADLLRAQADAASEEDSEEDDDDE